MSLRGGDDRLRAKLDALRRPGPVTLWTIQAEGAWARARERGVLKGDGRRVWRWHRGPYRWLMGQMAKRLPRYSGGSPI